MELLIPYVIPLSNIPPKKLTLCPSDPGSRYKTRQLQIQVVGKSKMIKTMLLNVLDVAKDCQVPPAYIGVFMGYVIGAQAKFDLKKPERQQAFLSGEHEAKDLSKIFLSFINEVLLCPTCNLPEIIISIEKDDVWGNCRACGSHSQLKIQDEKFKRYVINHPPTGTGFGGNKAGAKKDTSKKEEKPPKEKVEKESAEAKPKKIKDKGLKEEEVVWLSDTSDEAVRKRREEMLPDALNLVDKKDSVEDLTQALKDLAVKDAESMLQVKSKRNTDDRVFTTAVFTALFEEPNVDLLASINAKASILSKIVTNTAAQSALLVSIEKFCGKTDTTQLAKVPLILKHLYDNDILEEEVIIAWSEADKEKTSIKSVKDQAAPMIKWLKEAEEEGSEEEDN